MFSVVFEVKPCAGKIDDYLDNAEILRVELEHIEGFIDNVRYKSLTREGWVLSVSSWKDEKALVRWRTAAKHHEAQALGRSAIFEDYHLRVGQLVADSQLPSGREPYEQRFDLTEVGEGSAITLIQAKRPLAYDGTSNPAACAEYIGLDPYAADMTSWDIFEAVLTPGDLILVMSFKDEGAALQYEDLLVELPGDARTRRVRVIRDYGMRDRREAPQYFPPVEID
ncbi:MAG TPA: antibiotic biosynthesis monooxygenase [Rhizomicrobium sp.]|jgi:heme-degrading monooxygenase HmoA